MQNIAEFRIIGRVGSVDTTDKVTHVSVAANYNRKDGDEWKTDTHWNRVTFFRQLAERAADLGKGDLVHITGRVRQNSYESNGETRYSVDLRSEEHTSELQSLMRISYAFFCLHKKLNNHNTKSMI